MIWPYVVLFSILSWTISNKGKKRINFHEKLGDWYSYEQSLVNPLHVTGLLYPLKTSENISFFFVYTAFVKTSYSVTLINKESMDYLKFDVIGENGRKFLLNGG